MKSLQEELNLTYLFISHDLSVIRHFSNRVAVMYLGKIVELADTERLFKNPLHPYTQALLSAIPIPDTGVTRKQIILSGEVPSPMDPPSGCRFRTRCKFAEDRCSLQEPVLSEAEAKHEVSCFLYRDSHDL
jgi:oligopeptide/dipeptide ABC transporter ATP-binding protein